jgi:hypothetical protein
LTPPIPPNPDDAAAKIRKVIESLAKGDQASGGKKAEGSAQPKADTAPKTPVSKDHFHRARGEPLIELRDPHGNRVLMPLSVFESILRSAIKEAVSTPDDVHYDPEQLLAQLIENLPPAEQAQWLQRPVDSQLPPLRVQIPANQSARAVLETIVRLLAPLDLRFQDGLRALLGSEQFQQLFQGGKLSQGATQMFPNYQLVGVILPQGIFAQNPEAAKAFLIAQGLPATLIQNIPDQAVAGALHSLLVAGQKAGENPLLFLQSVASIFTLAGVPVQQVQNLLLGMLREAQAHGLKPMGGEMTPQALEQWAARLLAANNPQLLGLNQMVQENFGQGVTKILNAFIRVFFGGALMQAQLPWPQAVPNERMLAELGGLFAKQGEKAAEEGKKRSRAKKRSSRVEAVERDYRHVERKEDIADEPPLPPPMPSIFVDMDSED